MRLKPIIVVATSISAMSLGWVFNASVAQEGMHMPGRYQHTAVFRQEGLDRIYVTVLDTATGQVVRLDRFDTGDYEKPEVIPGR